jgi:DNA sulfur modification protein DndC
MSPNLEKIDSIEFKAESTILQLRQNYLKDQRPWVVAFSGGKDSTLLLELVYLMLLDIPPSDLKPVYIISSDTMVEPPNIAAYLKQTLARIKKDISQRNLPVEVYIVKPRVDSTFWAKLIGKGYPSPTRWFRWCTSTLKIRPTRSVIEKITREQGSVILLLGTRLDESSERRNRMNGRETSSRGLNPHHEIRNALVSSPIADWTTDEVWTYLQNRSAPWGTDHNELVSLYSKATGNECHMVFDMLSPSCGGSRFGCWTCTVVKKDISMQGFIRTGEAWMKPLNEFRDWLKEIREEPKRRMPFRRDGSKGMGPFTFETRKEIFEKLLGVEKEMGKELISDQEIAYINEIWTKEIDFQETALSLAAQFDREISEMKKSYRTSVEDKLLDDLFSEYEELPPELVRSLMDLVKEELPTLNTHGAKTQLTRKIKEILERSVIQKETADS